VRSLLADQSLPQVAVPLTVREKLMAMTDEEFKDYELKLQEAHTKKTARAKRKRRDKIYKVRPNQMSKRSE
jgi:hypothetical protein